MTKAGKKSIMDKHYKQARIIVTPKVETSRPKNGQTRSATKSRILKTLYREREANPNKDLLYTNLKITPVAPLYASKPNVNNGKTGEKPEYNRKLSQNLDNKIVRQTNPKKLFHM